MNRFSNTFQYEQYQSQQYQPQTQYQYEHYQSQSQSQSHKLQPKLRIAVSETAKRKKRNSKTTTKKRKKTATQEEKATAHIAMEDAEDDQVIMADDVDNDDDEINDIEFFSKLISLDKLNALVSDAATEITQLYDDFTFMKSNPFALHLYYSSKNYEQFIEERKRDNELLKKVIDNVALINFSCTHLSNVIEDLLNVLDEGNISGLKLSYNSFHERQEEMKKKSSSFIRTCLKPVLEKRIEEEENERIEMNKVDECSKRIEEEINNYNDKELNSISKECSNCENSMMTLGDTSVVTEMKYRSNKIIKKIDTYDEEYFNSLCEGKQKNNLLFKGGCSEEMKVKLRDDIQRVLNIIATKETRGEQMDVIEQELYGYQISPTSLSYLFRPNKYAFRDHDLNISKHLTKPTKGMNYKKVSAKQ